MEFTIGGVSFVEKAVFAKNMAVMIRSGLPIDEALGIAQEQATGKFKKIIGKILQSVEAGTSFSEALRKFPKVFSGLFASVVYAGESSGTLDKNLDIVANQLEKEKELITKVKGAMLYPAVILSAVFILGLGMSFLVLPQITPLLKALNVDLPLTTRILIGFSEYVARYGIPLFVGIVGALIFLFWLVRQKFMHPITHKIILKTPIIKHISRNTNLVRFCRTMGILLRSGLNIDEAIMITRDTVDNYYYKKALESVSSRIAMGVTASDALRDYDKLFPVLVTRMISIGEESGELEEVLFYLSDFYEIEVDTKTKSLSTALEPILLIVIGIVVAGFALAIITPIYEVTGNISPNRR